MYAITYSASPFYAHVLVSMMTHSMGIKNQDYQQTLTCVAHHHMHLFNGYYYCIVNIDYLLLMWCTLHASIALVNAGSRRDRVI
jgi:hypothetical protein